MIWVFADPRAQRVWNLQLLYVTKFEYISPGTPTKRVVITWSVASAKDKTSSGTLRSSSMNFEPVTTTVHRLRVGILKIECRYCRQKSPTYDVRITDL